MYLLINWLTTEQVKVGSSQRMNARYFCPLLRRIQRAGWYGVRPLMVQVQSTYFFKSLKSLFIYLSILGCAGSSLLCGLSLVAGNRGYSLVEAFRLCTVVASLVAEHELSSCGPGLVALQHVESSCTRNLTQVSCIARQIPNHGTTREVQPIFLISQSSVGM